MIQALKFTLLLASLVLSGCGDDQCNTPDASGLADAPLTSGYDSGVDAPSQSTECTGMSLTEQQLDDGALDLATLEAFANGAPAVVVSRLGTNIKNLSLLAQEAQGELSFSVLDDVPTLQGYTRPVGTTAVVLRGLASAGDGKGWVYLFKSGSLLADDGLNVVVGADGSRWFRWDSAPCVVVLDDVASLQGYTRPNNTTLAVLRSTGHLYDFDRADTSSADDGRDVIVGAAGSRWKRVAPVAEHAVLLGTYFPVVGAGWSQLSSGVVQTTDISDKARWQLPVKSGSKLTSVRVRLRMTNVNERLRVAVRSSVGTSFPAESELAFNLSEFITTEQDVEVVLPGGGLLVDSNTRYLIEVENVAVVAATSFVSGVFFSAEE